MYHLVTYLFTFLLCTIPTTAFAGEEARQCGYFILDAVNTLPGIIALVIFAVAYILVILEEFIHLRKSKPIIFASGIIWLIVALIAKSQGSSELAEISVKHNIQEYGELFLFLLVAMTYVNALQERKVFDALRVWLVNRGYTLRQLFWVTGILAFFISPVADNLTTALIMCAVVLAVGKHENKFISLACINIVLAANAGGAFCPFGDITTLMVWQKGKVDFLEFFGLFFPAAVSYIIPATVMSLFVPKTKPEAQTEDITIEVGGIGILILFAITIITAVSFHIYLHMPPVIGMMTGLSFLKLYGYYIKMKQRSAITNSEQLSKLIPFDIIKKIERAEWDTLLFFYGVMLSVGGLATIGYLHNVSLALYTDLDLGLSAIHHATPANIAVGFLSAIVDNIPVMFAILTMSPDMSHGQWMLVTLTAGIGGSILSIGSAAGVALMGQARGHYTFFSHLKWTPVIILGYIAGVAVHIILNAKMFTQPI